MVEFVYDNAKQASMGHTLFELNCKYHSRVSYEEDINPRSWSKVANELTKKLKNIMAAYRENLQHTQELQKRAHNRGTKPRSYVPDENIWLNSKYIKTKRNQKLEVKFFRFFRVLYPVGS